MESEATIWSVCWGVMNPRNLRGRDPDMTPHYDLPGDMLKEELGRPVSALLTQAPWFWRPGNHQNQGNYEVLLSSTLLTWVTANWLSPSTADRANHTQRMQPRLPTHNDVIQFTEIKRPGRMEEDNHGK